MALVSDYRHTTGLSVRPPGLPAPFVGLDAEQLGAMWNALAWCQRHCVVDGDEAYGDGAYPSISLLARLGVGGLTLRVRREGE